LEHHILAKLNTANHTLPPYIAKIISHVLPPQQSHMRTPRPALYTVTKVPGVPHSFEIHHIFLHHAVLSLPAAPPLAAKYTLLNVDYISR
jgi:hypothetical protein